MAIYMEFEGIPGQVTAKGHEKWITLDSTQWGIGRGISTRVGSAENREASTVSVSEMVVTQSMDKATGPLWNELTTGTDGKTVKVHFTSTDEGGENVYMSIDMEETLISSMSFSSGGDRPSISIALNFTKVETKYMEQSQEGADAATADGVIYNLATGKSG